MRHVILILLLVLPIISNAQENLYSSLAIPDGLKKNANAVVRVNSVEVVIESQRDMTVTTRRVVTVLNEKGRSIVNAGSGYDNFFKIKKIEAIIYNDYGEEIKKIKKKDFIDHSAVDGGTLYSDSRVLFMGYTPTSYPYTVEFNCEIQSSNTAAIPSWDPIDDYYVGVEKDVFRIHDVAGLGLKFKEKNLIGFDNIEIKNSETSLEYIIKDVPAIKPEDLSPSISSIMPQVLVAIKKFHFNGVDGEADNWKEYGDWVNDKLLKGRDKVSEETEKKILELVKDLEDPLQKAKIIYKYVQDNLRYISVQVGIGGIQPIEALEVDKLKYGDCKGLTNYTQSLLRIAGVESSYCIVEAGRNIVDFEDNFPTLAQGNHIILCIPNNEENIWLDCTSQVHPFGFIGDFTDARKVLVVKDHNSKIIETQVYSDSTNYQSINSEIDLKEDASIFSRLTIATKGIQYDNRFFIEREPDKDVKDFYKNYWGYVNNLDLESYSFNNDMDHVIFTEDLSVSASNYATLVGDRLLFPINVFNRTRSIPDRYRERKLPFEIQRGYLDEDTCLINLPQGYSLESLPKNISLSNKYGIYNVEFEEKDNKILYKRMLLIRRGFYPKEDYKDYRAFKKAVVNHDNLKIVLKKSV